MKTLLCLEPAAHHAGAELIEADAAAWPALLAQGAVVPASQMPAWLDWQSFGVWVDEQRQQALAQVELEAASQREQRLADIDHELACLQADRHLALSRIHLQALAELGQSLAQWCDSFAQQAARRLADTLLQDEHALARLFAAGLSELLAGLGDVVPVSIHCAAVDQAAIDEALAHGLPAVRLRARVAVEPELTPGRCLLRLGQEAYEIDLPQWLQTWQDQIGTDCATLVQALGLPAAAYGASDESAADDASTTVAEEDPMHFGSDHGRDADPDLQAHAMADAMTDDPNSEGAESDAVQEAESDDLAWLDDEDLDPETDLTQDERQVLDGGVMPSMPAPWRGTGS